MVVQNSDGLSHVSTSGNHSDPAQSGLDEGLWCSIQKPLMELAAPYKAFMDGCRTAQSKMQH